MMSNISRKKANRLKEKVFSISKVGNRQVRGPNNPEDPSNMFFKSLNMGSISSRKHELEILNTG